MKPKLLSARLIFRALLELCFNPEPKQATSWDLASLGQRADPADKSS